MKHLTIKGIDLHENEDGRWLTFKTKDGSQAALNINLEFPEGRIVHTVIREWAKEQTDLPSDNLHPVFGDILKSTFGVDK